MKKTGRALFCLGVVLALFPARLMAKPMNLEAMILGPQDLPPGVNLAVLGAKVDKTKCLQQKRNNLKLKDLDCDRKTSLPNPYIYLDPLSQDANSKNLYPGVKPATLANAVVTFYSHQEKRGLFGYVLLNYKDKTPADVVAYGKEWPKVLRVVKKSGGAAYARVYRQGPQGFFVFREKMPGTPQHEIPKTYLDGVYEILRARLQGVATTASPLIPMEKAMGSLPRHNLPGGITLSRPPTGMGNPFVQVGLAAQRLGQRLFPETDFSRVMAVRVAYYDHPSSDLCRLTITTLLLKGGTALQEAQAAADYLQKNLFLDPSTRLFYGARTVHHVGQSQCPSDKITTREIAGLLAKNNPGLREIPLSKEKGKELLTAEVNAFLKKLTTCLHNKNGVCLQSLLSDGKSLIRLKNEFKNAPFVRNEMKNLLVRQGATGAALKDLLLLQKAEKMPIFEASPPSPLQIKAPVKTDTLSLYMVDREGLPVMKTRTLRASAHLAGKFAILPKEGGLIRLTIRRVVLERTPKGLFLVAWE